MSTNKDVITVVLFGQGKSGKTSILSNFLWQNFPISYNPTVEDVSNRHFITNGIEYHVQFIDTGSVYEFPAMWNIYIHKAQAFILVMSVTDNSSLGYLDNVYAQIANERGIDFHIFSPLMIIANKIDCSDQRTLSHEAIEHWLQFRKIHEDKFIYTSAKTGTGIENIFKSLWYQKYRHNSNKDLSPKHDYFTLAQSLRRCSDAIIIPSVKIERNRVSESLRVSSNKDGDLSTLGVAWLQLSLSKSNEVITESTANVGIDRSKSSKSVKNSPVYCPIS